MSQTDLRRYCAVIEYDGTDFFGFQRQVPAVRTVQGEVEKALSKIGNQPRSVTAAGRTDAGVHATGQVISFQLNWNHDLPTLRKALNVNLPPDVAIRHIEAASDGFHPRFDAWRREYTYFIERVDSGEKRPISHRYRWQVSKPLNLVVMNQAAALLIGAHDFATFGTPPQGNNTVREVFAARWVETGNLLSFTIQANAFLFRMVRTLVGTIKRVGDQSWSLDRFNTVFQAKDRHLAASPAPPNGLFLTQVTYEKGLTRKRN